MPRKNTLLQLIIYILMFFPSWPFFIANIKLSRFNRNNVLGHSVQFNSVQSLSLFATP